MESGKKMDINTTKTANNIGALQKVQADLHLCSSLNQKQIFHNIRLLESYSKFSGTLWEYKLTVHSFYRLRIF